MKKQAMLRHAISQAKNQILEGFETIYILTYQDAYAEALVMSKEEISARKLLEDGFVEIYQNIQEIPDADGAVDWIRETVRRIGQERSDFDQESGLIGKLSEEKAATILLQIEERVGVNEREEESNKNRTYFFSFIKITMAIMAVIAAFFAVSFGWKQIKVFSNKLKSHIEISATNQAGSKNGLIEKKAEEDMQKGIQLHIAGQIFSVSDDGKIINVKIVDDIKYNPPIQETKDWTYYLSREREKDVMPEIDPKLEGKLFRVAKNAPEGYNIIAEEVEDYLIRNDSIYFMRSGTVHRIDSDEEYLTTPFSYHTVMREDGFYLLDNIGSPAKQGANRELQINERIYHLVQGKIESIEQSPIKTSGYTYYLSDNGKEIIRTNDSENEVLVRENDDIDTFCIAENWIYYSVVTEKDPEGIHYSRLYRSKTDGTEKQEMHTYFNGRIKKMYYYADRKEIYAEYMIDEDTGYYGRIAVISLEGQMSYIKDSEQRSGGKTTGIDMLELVIVEGENVYCFWNHGNRKPDEDPSVIRIKPLILSNRARICIE